MNFGTLDEIIYKNNKLVCRVNEEIIEKGFKFFEDNILPLMDRNDIPFKKGTGIEISGCRELKVEEICFLRGPFLGAFLQECGLALDRIKLESEGGVIRCLLLRAVQGRRMKVYNARQRHLESLERNIEPQLRDFEDDDFGEEESEESETDELDPKVADISATESVKDEEKYIDDTNEDGNRYEHEDMMDEDEDKDKDKDEEEEDEEEDVFEKLEEVEDTRKHVLRKIEELKSKLETYLKEIEESQNFWEVETPVIRSDDLLSGNFAGNNRGYRKCFKNEHLKESLRESKNDRLSSLQERTREFTREFGRKKGKDIISRELTFEDVRKMMIQLGVDISKIDVAVKIVLNERKV